MRRDDQKDDKFKITKRMVKINPYIIDDQYKRNDDGGVGSQ